MKIMNERNNISREKEMMKSSKLSILKRENLREERDKSGNKVEETTYRENKLYQQ